MRVLVAEDDAQLCAQAKQVVETAGMKVECAADADGADAAMRERHFDALVLDVQISGRAGEALLRGLRARSDRTPVILLLLPECPVTERARLLDLGADDYVLKPFDAIELGARLRALLRRSAAAATDKIRCGPLQLLRHARIAAVDGKRVELTNREFWILDVLMRNQDRSMSRRELEEALYGWGEEVESNAIEVHIHHLRRKLGAGLIQTVRGVGYQVVADATAAQAGEAQTQS